MFSNQSWIQINVILRYKPLPIQASSSLMPSSPSSSAASSGHLTQIPLKYSSVLGISNSCSSVSCPSCSIMSPGWKRRSKFLLLIPPDPPPKNLLLLLPNPSSSTSSPSPLKNLLPKPSSSPPPPDASLNRSLGETAQKRTSDSGGESWWREKRYFNAKASSSWAETLKFLFIVGALCEYYHKGRTSSKVFIKYLRFSSLSKYELQVNFSILVTKWAKYQFFELGI